MEGEPRQIYGGWRPKSYRLAHNHIIHTPGFSHGLNGFRRFWIPRALIASKDWVRCPCGWRPDLGTHYARAEHVEWWHEQIKKRGSLQAVHKYIIRRLTRDK